MFEMSASSPKVEKWVFCTCNWNRFFAVPRRSLRKLRPDEWAKESEIRNRQEFDAAIKAKHGDSFTIPASAPNPQDDDGSFEPECFGENQHISLKRK